MSKVDDCIKALQDNLGEWTCAFCASNSDQPAATIRAVRAQGYQLEQTGNQRWDKRMYCPTCGTMRTHYKLLQMEPVFEDKPRIPIPPKTRKRILKIFDERDAFTGASIAAGHEIDHKTPWTRLDHDIDASQMSDEEIKEHFQLLTRDHNLLKDRACSECKETNLRPPLFDIPFWYEGTDHYCGTCRGCGWYDGAKWREAIARQVSH